MARPSSGWGGGGGQEDGIAMKDAQSKVKWGSQWGGPWCEWGGGHGPQAPPVATPLSTKPHTKIGFRDRFL